MGKVMEIQSIPSGRFEMEFQARTTAALRCRISTTYGVENTSSVLPETTGEPRTKSGLSEMSKHSNKGMLLCSCFIYPALFTLI